MRDQRAAPSRSALSAGRLALPVVSLLFVLLWSSGFIVGKIATRHMQVPTVLLWRFSIALVVMVVVVAVTRPARPHGRAWIHLVVTALLLQVGQPTFVYIGLSREVPAGLSSLILGFAPLLVGLLTPLVLAARLGVAPVLGLVIGTGGVYIVLSDELGGGLGAQLVYPVLGMLALAAGTLYQKRFNNETPVTTSVVVQMVTALVVTISAMPFLGARWLPDRPGGWAAVVWLGLFNSAGVFVLMFLLLQWRSTVHISVLLNLVPATTALVAVPILGEPLTVRAVLGLAVALVGMYVGLDLVHRRRDDARASPQEVPVGTGAPGP